MTYRDKNGFSETINISSNIKANKKTIIAKFDLKDILFILIAGVIGIGVLSVMLVTLSIRNMFLLLIVLALFEVPIVTVGFLKLHDIPVLDYIKMKNKSDNKSYRKQILKKKVNKGDKYILPFVVIYEPNFNRLEQIMSDLHKLLHYKKAMLKIMFDKIFLIIETREEFDIIYNDLFDYLRLNKDIKYISNDDVKNYETYIKSLKFIDKKYSKKQIKNINQFKGKINKFKTTDFKNDKFVSITNDIIANKQIEFIKVIKFILYKHPFDINVFNELKEYCNITSHIVVDAEEVKFSDLNFIDTFIDITSSGETCEPALAMAGLDAKVKEILDKHNILYKEIS